MDRNEINKRIAQTATRLDGREYGHELTGEEAGALETNQARLVVVFGASDDLMEFQGAIDDEIGAYEGTAVFITEGGLLKNECDSEDCPHFAKMQQAAPWIEACWEPGDGLSWAYNTDIPHETFEIVEDGEPYCRGIVFSLLALTADEGTQ